MQLAKLLFVALLLTISAVGCSESKPTPVQGKELTPEAIAEQEKILSDAEASERLRNKK